MRLEIVVPSPPVHLPTSTISTEITTLAQQSPVFGMSLPDMIHVDHMLHLLPTTISDHEGDGALVGRYEVKGSRCPSTEALSVQEVMESVDTIRKFLLGGQGRWQSLYESAGPSESEATLDAWREDMKTAATSLWTGPMESLVLASSSGSNRLAFKMYRTRDDFKTLELKPVYHIITYVIPRFYQLQSPWAPISVTFDSSIQKPVFASDIYAPADQWESCKSALKSALESLRLKTPEQVKTNPAAGRNQADEWRGTLGISLGTRLRARSA